MALSPPLSLPPLPPPPPPPRLLSTLLIYVQCSTAIVTSTHFPTVVVTTLAFFIIIIFYFFYFFFFFFLCSDRVVFAYQRRPWGKRQHVTRCHRHGPCIGTFRLRGQLFDDVLWGFENLKG
jgi:hypothetical protein